MPIVQSLFNALLCQTLVLCCVVSQFAASCCVKQDDIEPSGVKAIREQSSDQTVVWHLDGEYHLVEPGIPPRSEAPHFKFEPNHMPDFRATEWKLWLPQSSGSSEVINDLSSADFEIVFPSNRPTVLHWNTGSHGLPSDFQPHSVALNNGSEQSFESIGGRSSDGTMPYFHVEDGNGGIIFAIGWSGDWRCIVSKSTNPNSANPNSANQEEQGNRVKIKAGLKHQSLKPKNATPLRMPSILVMTYKGNRDDGHNQFRRLMLRHFTPTNHPSSELMPIAASVHGMIGFNDTNESNLITTLDRISSLSLPVDTFWLDAGWNELGFPAGQGNLQHDPSRFPTGLAKIGAMAKQKQLRFLLWFEPERVMRNTGIANDFPEWLLKPSNTPPEFRYFESDGFFLFNLASDEARSWMLEQISEQITKWNVGIYRQDANIAPGFYWHTDRAPEDAAMLEIEYINGLYHFLDELQRKHPALIIDGCAAGGRRLDFEMMRRSVVLWRSDSCWGDSQYPRNVQAMTMGLSRWLPLHGLGSAPSDAISLRSGLGACGSFAINFHDPSSVESLRNHLNHYRPVRHVFQGDFYPLTEWSLDGKLPIAYQFHDPNNGHGVVQIFCEDKRVDAPIQLRLRGLEQSRTYTLSDWDNRLSLTRKGDQLMTDGFPAFFADNTQAIVVEYRPVSQ